MVVLCLLTSCFLFFAVCLLQTVNLSPQPEMFVFEIQGSPNRICCWVFDFGNLQFGNTMSDSLDVGAIWASLSHDGSIKKD